MDEEQDGRVPRPEFLFFCFVSSAAAGNVYRLWARTSICVGEMENEINERGYEASPTVKATTLPSADRPINDER